MVKYQNIIKDRDLRVKIIQCFGFIPDEYMIRFQYFVKAKRVLNLKCPKRYTEKIQWYKLYYRNPVMTYSSPNVFLIYSFTRCLSTHIVITGFL